MLSIKVFSFPLVIPVYTYKMEASRLQLLKGFTPVLIPSFKAVVRAYRALVPGVLDVGIC